MLMTQDKISSSIETHLARFRNASRGACKTSRDNLTQVFLLGKEVDEIIRYSLVIATSGNKEIL